MLTDLWTRFSTTPTDLTTWGRTRSRQACGETQAALPPLRWIVPMKRFEDFGIEIPPGRTGNVSVRCPWCADDRRKNRLKTLSVNVELGIWNCHHCAVHGSLRDGNEAREMRELRRPVVKSYVAPSPPEVVKLTLRAQQWLANRGFSADVIEAFGLYSETIWMPQLNGETATIAFPYRRAGALVNVKYRDSKKNFRMVKDAEKILYNLDACLGSETVVIAEGEMDVLAFATAGIIAAVSVPNGAPAENVTDANLDYLSSGEAVFAGATKIILAVDNDGPGQRLAIELARRIGREKCWSVVWPDGCKDANDVLLKHGADALRAAIEEAVPLPVEGIVHVRDVENDVWSLYVDGLPRGKRTGWAELDELYSVQGGQWTLVTGIPGSGKSNFVDALCVNLAVHEDWRFAVCSPENQPVARHIAGLAAKFARAPFADGPTPRMGVDDLTGALEWTHEHFAFILPEEPTVDAILERARVLVFRMGIRGLVIDPWNELDHSRPDNRTQTEYISQSLSRIRQFARHHGVHIWLVAHPTKLQKGQDGQYPVPTPYDVSDSAHWYNKADNALSIWRDKGDLSVPVQVHVQKIRFAEVGKLGVANLHYDVPTARYLSPDGWKAGVA